MFDKVQVLSAPVKSWMRGSRKVQTTAPAADPPARVLAGLPSTDAPPQSHAVPVCVVRAGVGSPGVGVDGAVAVDHALLAAGDGVAVGGARAAPVVKPTDGSGISSSRRRSKKRARRSSSAGAERGTPTGGRGPPSKEATTPPGVNKDLAVIEEHLTKTINPDRIRRASGDETIQKTLIKVKKFAKWVVVHKKRLANLRDLVKLGADEWISNYWVQYAETELRGRLRLK